VQESELKQFAESVKGAALELGEERGGLGRYLLSTEAHVYAFAIAANVLLSFWPFMLVMIALLQSVLHWPAAVTALYAAIQDFNAGATGKFLVFNLQQATAWGHKVEWVSMGMLLFTANGVFLPLEVALNRAWGVTVNRPLWKNQLVSMGLIFACGVLALLSAVMTGAGIQLWQAVFGADQRMPGLLVQLMSKIASIPVTVLILFLVYCFLPNRKVPARLVLPRAVVVGLVLELLKWINLLIWPWMRAKFDREFGVFVNSVTILTWSFLSGLVVLAGAEWTARRARQELAAGAPDRGVESR
jgi:YihY family inner membrane protein